MTVSVSLIVHERRVQPIAMLSCITDMLSTNPYMSIVHVIALDFSKAFDTVRHTWVLDKLNLLNLPDHIYM